MIEYYIQKLVRKLVLNADTLPMIEAELRAAGVGDDELAAFRETFLLRLQEMGVHQPLEEPDGA